MNITVKAEMFIESQDLEELINKTYGFPTGYSGYSIAAVEEIGLNHTVYYPYYVDYDNFYEDFPEDIGLNTGLSYILHDLLKRGLIHSGRYLINVSW